MIGAVIASALGLGDSSPLDHKEHVARALALKETDADCDRTLAALREKHAREMQDAHRSAEATKADARARVAAAEERADLDIATAFYQSIAPLIVTFRETPSRSTAIAIRAELDRTRARLRDELGDATGDAFRLIVLAIARSFDPTPSISLCEDLKVHEPARRFAEAAPTSGAALYEALIEIEQHVEKVASSNAKEPADTALLHFGHACTRRRHRVLDDHRKAANAAREKASAEAYARDVYVSRDGRSLRRDSKEGREAIAQDQSMAMHGRSLTDTRVFGAHG